MLVLTRSQVEALLDTEALIDALAEAMVDLSEGRASVPDRVAAFAAGGLLAAMPGYEPSGGVLMTKLVTLFPSNRELPTHQAVIVAFDQHTGEPVALLDGTAITASRTAACSALSAKLLARPEAETLAIVGTGVQARSHAHAMTYVRPISEIRVAGRDPVKAERLAGELAGSLNIATSARSYQDALVQADIVCATTHSGEPVIRREWLADGTHVTSVGYNPGGRELDDATVADALVCVESRKVVLAPVPAGSNDLLMPIQRGVITADHVHAELGELIAGTKPGRATPEQITLYKSVGVAVQDAAAVGLVLAAARKNGIGQEIVI